MADVTTVHKIEESIRVVGAAAVEKTFAVLGKGADKVSASFKKMKFDVAGSLKQGAAFALAQMGISASFHVLYDKTWALNEALEEMTNQTRGALFALTDVSKMPALSQLSVSGKGAQAVLSELRDTAVEVAAPVKEVFGVYKGLVPVVTALGKNQAEVLDYVRSTASAARVMGADFGTAESFVKRLIMRGKIGRTTDPFGIALATEAGVKKADSLEARYKKVGVALAKIGAPVKELTRGTGYVLERWTTLTNSVLQRATLPVYEAIGKATESAVEWVQANKADVAALADLVGGYLLLSWKTVGLGVKAVGYAVGSVFDAVGMVFTGGAKLVDLFVDAKVAVGAIGEYFGGKVLSGAREVSGWIGQGVTWLEDQFGWAGRLYKLGVATVEEWAKPAVEWFGRGVDKVTDIYAAGKKWVTEWTSPVLDAFGKIEEKVDAIWAKFESGASKARGALELVAQPWKAIGRFFGGASDVAEAKVMWSRVDRERAGEVYGKRSGIQVASGMFRGFTDFLGLTDPAKKSSEQNARDFLKTITSGKRPLLQMDVAKVEIHNDLRGMDPDDIMVEMIQTFERLGDAAVSSAAGGRATQFGPGAAT